MQKLPILKFWRVTVTAADPACCGELLVVAYSEIDALHMAAEYDDHGLGAASFLVEQITEDEMWGRDRTWETAHDRSRFGGELRVS